MPKATAIYVMHVPQPWVSLAPLDRLLADYDTARISHKGFEFYNAGMQRIVIPYNQLDLVLFFLESDAIMPNVQGQGH
jgi:hypothetical protein